MIYLTQRPMARTASAGSVADRAASYLAKLPPAISGARGHDAAFRAACVLVHGFALEPDTALNLIRAWNATCQPPWSEHELAHKINGALYATHRHPRGYLLGGAYAWQPRVSQAIARTRGSAWPSVNIEQRDAILAEGARLHDLWAASPVPTKNAEPATEEIIDALFPGNPLLCVGESSSRFVTRPRGELRGELPKLALIGPSPMTAQTGQTKDGRTSAHTLDNTGPRRWLVVEFDTGNSGDHAAILLHLAARAPFALAVHSGGKSLHGWFGPCVDEDTSRRFMRYAVSLGADPATWTRSQFVRMPDGTRENGMRQTLWFYNPAIMEGAR